MIVEKKDLRRNGMILFKIGKYANHPRARRKYSATLYAEDLDHAIAEFESYVSMKDDKESCRYVLCDGKWNVITYFN